MLKNFHPAWLWSGRRSLGFVSTYSDADLNFSPWVVKRENTQGAAVLRGPRGQAATQCALAVILSGDCTVPTPAAVEGSEAPSQHREAPHGHRKLS